MMPKLVYETYYGVLPCLYCAAYQPDRGGLSRECVIPEEERQCYAIDVTVYREETVFEQVIREQKEKEK